MNAHLTALAGIPGLVRIYLAIAGVILALPAAESLTYTELVRRLTDLRQLANAPAVGEQNALASSYDRQSRYDPDLDRYVGWDANQDGTGMVRAEGDTSVLAESEGPGCIWRIWSATAGAGHVRIFLDGAEHPAVDLPFSSYFSGTDPCAG
jgi:hypothetical protein